MALCSVQISRKFVLCFLSSLLKCISLCKKYGLSSDDLRAIVGLMLLRGEAVQPALTVGGCRDPKDDMFLQIAVGGGADVLVTGDQDLLLMNPFHGIPIETPRQFLDRFVDQTL